MFLATVDRLAILAELELAGVTKGMAGPLIPLLISIAALVLRLVTA